MEQTSKLQWEKYTINFGKIYLKSNFKSFSHQRTRTPNLMYLEWQEYSFPMNKQRWKIQYTECWQDIFEKKV